MHKYTKRFSAIFTAVLMLLSLCSVSNALGGTVDLSRQGSITVNLKEAGGEHDPIADETFMLWQAARMKIVHSNPAYDFTEDFTGCGINPGELGAEGAAEHLAAYALEKNLEAESAVTDKNGRVSFTNLEPGAYLVVQKGDSPAYFPVKPFVIHLPMTSPDGTEWIYDIDASPKTEPRPLLPEEDKSTELTVRKVWVDDGRDRPESITVTLSKDGLPFKDEILNEANGWQFTWDKLDETFLWSVSEKEVPENYTAEYSQEETVTTITNTKKAEIPAVDKLSVIKEWIDDEDSIKYRPASVTVELRCSGEVYDTAVLSEANNWKATWKDLPAGTWTAAEVNPSEDYEVSYEEEDGILYVVNTALSIINPNPTPEIDIDAPDMPLVNAGQLNWPVPVMALAGLVLMGAGAVIIASKRNNHEA